MCHQFGTKACFLSLLCLLMGCGGSEGPELGQVAGKITIDGKPAPKLIVRFVPQALDGSPSYGATNADGEYTLMFTADRNGAMPGKHRVEIEAVPPETDEEGNPLPDQVTIVVPDRYHEAGTLTAEVTAGNNTFDFALESE